MTTTVLPSFGRHPILATQRRQRRSQSDAMSCPSHARIISQLLASPSKGIYQTFYSGSTIAPRHPLHTRPATKYTTLSRCHVALLTLSFAHIAAKCTRWDSRNTASVAMAMWILSFLRPASFWPWMVSRLSASVREGFTRSSFHTTPFMHAAGINTASLPWIQSKCPSNPHQCRLTLTRFSTRPFKRLPVAHITRRRSPASAPSTSGVQACTRSPPRPPRYHTIPIVCFRNILYCVSGVGPLRYMSACEQGGTMFKRRKRTAGHTNRKELPLTRSCLLPALPASLVDTFSSGSLRRKYCAALCFMSLEKSKRRWLHVNTGVQKILAVLRPIATQIADDMFTNHFQRLPNPRPPHNEFLSRRLSSPLNIPGCAQDPGTNDYVHTLESLHQKPLNLNFHNVSLHKWSDATDGPWELAKAFVKMSIPEPSSVVDADTSDASVIVAFLRFMKTSPFAKTNIHKLADARNNWAHSVSQSFDQTDFDAMMQSLVDVAKCIKSASNSYNARDLLSSLTDLSSNPPILNDAGRVLEDALAEMRRVLAMEKAAIHTHLDDAATTITDTVATTASDTRAHIDNAAATITDTVTANTSDARARVDNAVTTINDTVATSASDIRAHIDDAATTVTDTIATSATDTRAHIGNATSTITDTVAMSALDTRAHIDDKTNVTHRMIFFLIFLVGVGLSAIFLFPPLSYPFSGNSLATHSTALSQPIAPLSEHDVPPRFILERKDPTFCIGREEDLRRLEHLLVTERHSLVSVHGLPGIGKSTVANKFINIFLSNFSHIVWLDEWTHSNIGDVVKNKFEKLTLSSTFPALIVLDNVNDFGEITPQLHSYLVHRQVLFLGTSRLSSASAIVDHWSTVSLQSLPLPSLRLLLCTEVPSCESESDSVNSLLEHLDGLTLAISLSNKVLRYDVTDQGASTTPTELLKRLRRGVDQLSLRSKYWQGRLAHRSLSLSLCAVFAEMERTLKHHVGKHSLSYRATWTLALQFAWWAPHQVPLILLGDEARTVAELKSAPFHLRWIYRPFITTARVFLHVIPRQFSFFGLHYVALKWYSILLSESVTESLCVGRIAKSWASNSPVSLLVEHAHVLDSRLNVLVEIGLLRREGEKREPVIAHRLLQQYLQLRDSEEEYVGLDVALTSLASLLGDLKCIRPHGWLTELLRPHLRVFVPHVVSVNRPSHRYILSLLLSPPGGLHSEHSTTTGYYRPRSFCGPSDFPLNEMLCRDTRRCVSTYTAGLGIFSVVSIFPCYSAPATFWHEFFFAEVPHRADGQHSVAEEYVAARIERSQQLYDIAFAIGEAADAETRFVLFLHLAYLFRSEVQVNSNRDQNGTEWEDIHVDEVDQMREKLLEPLLVQAESEYGGHSPLFRDDVCRADCWLALLYVVMGRYANDIEVRIQWFRKANELPNVIEGCTKMIGRMDLLLADALWDAKQYKEALALYEPTIKHSLRYPHLSGDGNGFVLVTNASQIAPCSWAALTYLYLLTNDTSSAVIAAEQWFSLLQTVEVKSYRPDYNGNCRNYVFEDEKNSGSLSQSEAYGMYLYALNSRAEEFESAGKNRTAVVYYSRMHSLCQQWDGLTPFLYHFQEMTGQIRRLGAQIDPQYCRWIRFKLHCMGERHCIFSKRKIAPQSTTNVTSFYEAQVVAANVVSNYPLLRLPSWFADYLREYSRKLEWTLSDGQWGLDVVPI